MLEQDRKDLERRIAELQRRKAAERAEADRAARGGASGSTNRVRTDSARTIRPDAKSYAQRPEKQLVAPPSYIREDRAPSGQKKKRPDGQKRPSGQRPRVEVSSR